MTFHQNGHVTTASMPQTLYLSSTISPNATLLKPPLPAPPPKLLRLPSAPSSSPTISLPPNPKPLNTHLQENLFYLDSLGIDSFHCLTSHPQLVSASLPQFKSAIDFLLNLNLNIQEIRRVLHMCPEILTASLPHTLRPAVTFLLREARVEGRHLPAVIRRRPRLLTRSVEEQLRPTLYFLQSAVGIEDVSKCATLLSCSVETKFIPRLDYFQKLGFSKREATTFFTILRHGHYFIVCINVRESNVKIIDNRTLPKDLKVSDKYEDYIKTLVTAFKEYLAKESNQLYFENWKTLLKSSLK